MTPAEYTAHLRTRALYQALPWIGLWAAVSVIGGVILGVRA